MSEDFSPVLWIILHMYVCIQVLWTRTKFKPKIRSAKSKHGWEKNIHTNFQGAWAIKKPMIDRFVWKLPLSSLPLPNLKNRKQKKYAPYFSDIFCVVFNKNGRCDNDAMWISVVVWVGGDTNSICKHVRKMCEAYARYATFVRALNPPSRHPPPRHINGGFWGPFSLSNAFLGKEIN